MKNLNNFLIEEDDETSIDSRRALVQFISSNFFRFVQNPDQKDDRGMLLLIAAISLLNMGDDLQTINTAKRLAQLALTTKMKKKKEK
jgi:hypothetical protein